MKICVCFCLFSFYIYQTKVSHRHHLTSLALMNSLHCQCSYKENNEKQSVKPGQIQKTTIVCL